VTAPQVVILTGRSDPARTGLPPAQSAFLAAVTPPRATGLDDGFPWVGGPPEGHIRLPLAAWRNAVAWHAARTGKAGPDVAGRLEMLGDRPRAIITGSCGLDLLVSGWRPGRCKVVIALGPVTRRRPRLPGVAVTTIIGRWDGLSRLVHRDAPDVWVPGGHMGYWTCPKTRNAVVQILGRWVP